MKGWWAGFLMVLVACACIVASRSASPELLQDTDTKVLLAKLQERANPWSWFLGDWPLGNHFYRPISTLTFELDLALWGHEAAGYGLTNAIVCALSVLALFWFLTEIGGRAVIAATGALLFAAWHGTLGPQLSAAVTWASWAVLVCAILPGRWPLAAIGAFLTTRFLAAELLGMYPLGPRMIQWLPSRTAGVMTLFALVALACYARYERTSAKPLPPQRLDPLVLPATKGTVPAGSQAKGAWVWAWASVLATLLALGSYEQAVMLPAALLVVAVALRLRRLRVRWGWHVAYWAVLVAYLALRYWLVPLHPSGYQLQQFRTGPGVTLALLGYVVPAAWPAWQALQAFAMQPIGLLLTPQAGAFADVIGQIVAFARASRMAPLLGAGFVLSVLTFLPMAWMKHFEHYHYWPMAMRALFVAALLPIAGAAWVSAASPRALRAPPRPDPAPGSLPRP